MHARLRGSKSLLTLSQIVNKPDFPSLADELAEPHPDINIKVAAFTVSEKSSNTSLCYNSHTRPTRAAIKPWTITIRIVGNVPIGLLDHTPFHYTISSPLSKQYVRQHVMLHILPLYETACSNKKKKIATAFRYNSLTHYIL